MSTIRVDLKSVQVVEGQGIGEGNMELNVKVQEGNNRVDWPDPYPAYQTVDQGGAINTTNLPQTVGTYKVASGTLSKLFSISVVEVDKGTLGQDDPGSGDLTFELTPNMAAQTKYATINLKGPNKAKPLGKVKVGLVAQVD
ncbi:MAG: hypothetical protein H0X37_23045 [Herpetosiphonaceae bacterium]|nr:hypothetical protein [Herpetosiphonaceae bacterium]